MVIAYILYVTGIDVLFCRRHRKKYGVLRLLKGQHHITIIALLLKLISSLTPRLAGQ